MAGAKRLGRVHVWFELDMDAVPNWLSATICQLSMDKKLALLFQ